MTNTRAQLTQAQQSSLYFEDGSIALVGKKIAQGKRGTVFALENGECAMVYHADRPDVDDLARLSALPKSVIQQWKAVCLPHRILVDSTGNMRGYLVISVDKERQFHRFNPFECPGTPSRQPSGPQLASNPKQNPVGSRSACGIGLSIAQRSEPCWDLHVPHRTLPKLEKLPGGGHLHRRGEAQMPSLRPDRTISMLLFHCYERVRILRVRGECGPVGGRCQAPFWKASQ